ncbi:haloacid dehalogenase-like hydrolase [Bradyrhizobium genosp. L]|uniref:haloacid dehalogenase-like hydrolase n=1 Tax=Bradyrhizobium genosp. L TaxID=83637 RepID=UPI0018A3242D|nr:haloacid dehalogenase-like hydrolase [Bradyrhizobium genosp. L]QPF82078.1 haloacid dehalogenase-like hydrolase [Bradyrhizobium genosp. L]
MTELRLDTMTIDRPAPRATKAGASNAVLSLPNTVPLVLDLDGTLIRGDLLYLSFFSILRRNPLAALMTPVWLLRGRAALKRQLALRNRIAWDRIILHEDVVALALREKATGRRVVLATAADAVLANQLASRLPWIDEVFASDGRHNLKGANKATLLRQTFPHGFIYAGDSASDLAVWAQAAGIITVNANEAVRKAVRALGKPTLHLPGRRLI